VLVCGGLHGNEPAGVEAARRVFARLERERVPLRGRLGAVAGNLQALAAGRRFLEIDLNRCWRREEIDALRAADPAADRAERAEQRALLDIVEAEGGGGGLVFLDLHTTSGDSPPFTLVSDTLRNRRLAFGLPVPVILGLEECIDGTLIEYLTRQGHIAAVVETGRHDDPRAVDLHEAVIWLALRAVGALAPRAVPERALWRRRLRTASRGLPRVLEVRHRHALAPGVPFTMEPGFRGFQAVAKGALLAHENGQPVRAPEAGRVLMPFYQQQGDDGFFLARPVRRFWLLLSRVVRTLRLGVLLPLLPGVERHPDRKGVLRVNPHVARVYVTEIFHLFGYRVRRPEGEFLLFSRRRGT